LFAAAQDELALQAPSLLMEQASANLSSTMTGRSNSSCASNLPAAPMPAAKPVQQEPELPKTTAPSVNRRKDFLFFLFFRSLDSRLIPHCLYLSLLYFFGTSSALLFRNKGIYHYINQRLKAKSVMWRR